jgi:hypothetical protein
MTLDLLTIPVLNRYDLLDRLIDSIDYSVKEIFIINNGKEKYTNKNKNFNVKIIDLPSNLGVAGSWNLAIKLYPHLKYWCFSSADSVFEKGEFKKMVDLSGPDKLCLSTHYTSSFSIGENIIRKVGLFDENYYPIYREYIDYYHRMEKLNLTSCIQFNSFSINSDENDHAMTIKSDIDLFNKNKITEENNKKYFDNKIKLNNIKYNEWDIDIRRKNSWD